MLRTIAVIILYMTMPISERRKIENEMIFRRLNEKVGDNLDSLDAMHIEESRLRLSRG